MNSVEGRKQVHGNVRRTEAGRARTRHGARKAGLAGTGLVACLLAALGVQHVFAGRAKSDSQATAPAAAPTSASSQPATKPPPATAATSRPGTPDTTDMVLVPAGEFMMGYDGPNARASSSPAHKVFLRAYYIDKYEVTKEKFCAFLNAAGKMTLEKGSVYDENKKMICRPDGLTQAGGKWLPMRGLEKHPAVCVTWYGADRYARHYRKRLPTEAEWEKAARGGTTTPWFFGKDPAALDEYAWHNGNCPERKTHEVGLKKANPLGLYDVYGNVYEVVADWYSEDYYSKSPARNPTGPERGDYHVRRGGSYYYSAEAGCNSWQRVSTKIGNEPEATFVDSNWGFRTAADAPAGP